MGDNRKEKPSDHAIAADGALAKVAFLQTVLLGQNILYKATNWVSCSWGLQSSGTHVFENSQGQAHSDARIRRVLHGPAILSKAARR